MEKILESHYPIMTLAYSEIAVDLKNRRVIKCRWDNNADYEVNVINDILLISKVR
jgi:hypothetical protein